VELHFFFNPLEKISAREHAQYHFQQFLFSSGFESHIKKSARKKNDYRTGAMRVSSGSQNPLEIYVFSRISSAPNTA
jgi:hypothetical protein